MKKKLQIKTYLRITPYSVKLGETQKVTPEAPVWVVKNTSFSTMSVNGSNGYGQNEGIGVSIAEVYGMAAYMLEKGIEVQIKNETQLEITYQVLDKVNGQFQGSFDLIETFIDYKWV
jgi:hypothetical protein